MKEAFLKFVLAGKAMSIEDLATILNISYNEIRQRARPGGPIPRIPHIWRVRFDPEEMIRVFCTPKEVPPPRSLTIERHKTGEKPIGGYRKCLR